jgi:hypothetical protein
MVYTSWLVDTLANFYNGIRELASSKNFSFCLEIFPSIFFFFKLVANHYQVPTRFKFSILNNSLLPHPRPLNFRNCSPPWGSTLHKSWERYDPIEEGSLCANVQTMDNVLKPTKGPIFTLDIKSMLNENLGGILGGTWC